MFNNLPVNSPDESELNRNQLSIYSNILALCEDELRTKLIIATDAICNNYLSFGMTKEDLYSGAYQGVLLASQNYDVHAKNFATYAKRWIHIGILSALINYHYNAVPEFLMEQYRLVKKRLVVFQVTQSTTCNSATINTLLQYKIKDYNVNKFNNPIDIMVYANEKIEEALDITQPTPFEALCYKDLQEVCLLYKQILTPKERKVIDMTLGFGSYTPLTPKHIAAEMNIGRSRVAQLYQSAISKMLQAIRCDVSNAVYSGASRLNVELLDPQSQEVLKAFIDKEVYWRGLDGLQDTGFTAEDVLNSLKLLI